MNVSRFRRLLSFMWRICQTGQKHSRLCIIPSGEFLARNRPRTDGVWGLSRVPRRENHIDSNTFLILKTFLVQSGLRAHGGTGGKFYLKVFEERTHLARTRSPRSYSGTLLQKNRYRLSNITLNYCKSRLSLTKYLISMLLNARDWNMVFLKYSLPSCKSLHFMIWQIRKF